MDGEDGEDREVIANNTTILADDLDTVVDGTNAVAVRDEAKAVLVATLRPIAERLAAYDRSAAMMTVNTKTEADAAVALLSQIKEDKECAGKAVETTVTQLHSLHKAWVSFRNRFVVPLDDTANIIKGKIASWQAAEDRKARELQAKLQAEADEKARREREALEKKAATMKTAEKQQEYIERAAAVAPAPVVSVTAEKVDGVRFRENWTFEVVDAAAIPREYLSVDHVAIGRVVRALKSKASIPGVRVYCQRV